jgi:subtilisin family serine protease
MNRLFIAVALTAVALIVPAGALAARSPNTDAQVSDAIFDRSSAIVVLKSLPIATYDGRIQGYERTKPVRGKLNPNSAAARKYKTHLSAEHAAFQKWLQRNVPSAKITSEYFVTMNAVAVKLNGAAKGKLLNSDVVQSVEFVTRYYPTMSESYKHINAEAAWQAAGGRDDAGDGIKIGILDTGIDANHPFFDPTGFQYPADGGPWPKCNPGVGTAACDALTSPKVIVAKVFGNNVAKMGWTAAPNENDHGTHVAGTAAGVTGKTAVVEGVAIDDMSGIAPGAWLGNYKVLLDEAGSGRSEDIVNGVEEAVRDGMDVLNLSLGGGYRGNNDIMAMSLDNAVEAGVVVVSTAGNNGPGSFTIGSPGRARNIITVGASTNDHFVGQPITYAGGTARGAVGDFPPLEAGTYDLVFLTGTNANGCAAIAPVPEADDTLMVLDRGVCSFSQKVFNAEAANADGVIVINNVAGDPTALGFTAGITTTISAVMISKDDGAALRQADPDQATVAENFDEFVTENEDILAGFSSQGPTFVNLDIKPDVTSVGVNVLSSVPCWMAEAGASCGGEGTWAFFNGTSMAAPHVAGSAAVLLDLHPNWTPARVKSAIVNTADRVVTDAFDGNHDVGPLLQGTGRQDLTEAANSTVSLFPTSAAFGKISGSQNQPTSMTITLTNSTGNPMTFAVNEKRFNPSTFGGTHAATFGAGDIVNGDSRITTPSTVRVPANGTATMTVTVNAPASGLIQGWLDLDGPNGNDYTVAYAAVAP